MSGVAAPGNDVFLVASRVASLIGIGIWECTMLLKAVVSEGLNPSGNGIAKTISERMPRVAERFGGAFPKLGQIASTRPDLLSEHVCRSLSRLQDKIEPLPTSVIEKVLARSYNKSPFTAFESSPIGSATIAQVHRAVRSDDGRPVAVKVMRPGIRDKLRCDCLIAQGIARVLGEVPSVRLLPLRDSVKEASTLVMLQTNFGLEALNLARLKSLFENTEVYVPSPHPDLCRDEILCMDFIEDLRKLDDPRLSDRLARQAFEVGTRALYRMIFEAGFIHCDMHPGNVLVKPTGKLVMLDTGLMAEMKVSTRKAFAQFLIAIGTRNGKSAGRILRQMAKHQVTRSHADAFDAQIHDLLQNLTVRDTTTAFVRDLLVVQRRHGVAVTSDFTSALVAVVLFEGYARKRFPARSFAREGLPYVMAAARS